LYDANAGVDVLGPASSASDAVPEPSFI
jgi:hypothetical protein